MMRRTRSATMRERLEAQESSSSAPAKPKPARPTVLDLTEDAPAKKPLQRREPYQTSYKELTAENARLLMRVQELEAAAQEHKKEKRKRRKASDNSMAALRRQLSTEVRRIQIEKTKMGEVAIQRLKEEKQKLDDITDLLDSAQQELGDVKGELLEYEALGSTADLKKTEEELIAKAKEVTALKQEQQDSETLIKVLEESCSSAPEWACGKCTFVNQGDKAKCVMCMQGDRPAAVVGVADEEEEEDEEDGERDYMAAIRAVTTAKKPELAKLCQTEGVSCKGTKAELQERLVTRYAQGMQRQALEAKEKEEEQSSHSTKLRKIMKERRVAMRANARLEAEKGNVKLCSICFENLPEYLAFPCRHICLCGGCAADMWTSNNRNCPICREDWNRRPVKVFHS